jgi:hypothetical protein
MNEKLDAILGGAAFVALFLIANFLPELLR